MVFCLWFESKKKKNGGKWFPLPGEAFKFKDNLLSMFSNVGSFYLYEIEVT